MILFTLIYELSEYYFKNTQQHKKHYDFIFS